jgi:ABC-type sugar transport system ATPase subunit
MHVLDGVSVVLQSGQVHGLVGGNGAGKSTLLRAMTGGLPVDGGRLLLNGRAFPTGSSRQARRHRIALINQDPQVIPALSVVDNVLLGRWGHRAGLRSRRSDLERVARLLERTGFRLDPAAPAGALSLPDRQRVEILRAFAGGARVLAFDEPTASLGKADAEQLLAMVRRLADDGVAVALTSHRLDDILTSCDLVTVLRDGRAVARGPVSEQTRHSLTMAMIGSRPVALFPRSAPVRPASPVVLSVRELRVAGAAGAVDLEVRAGEILGLAGRLGSGRTRLLRAIFGADRRQEGAVHIAQVPVRPGSPHQSVRAGLVFVPQSRLEEGLAAVLSVQENLTMPSLGVRFWAGPNIPRTERAMGLRLAGMVGLNGVNLDGPVGTLSGGNQQKVLFGKWLGRVPRVLLVDEPTRGVDVASRARIHCLLADLARGGTAVVLTSADPEELLTLADRILVMRHGSMVGTVASGQGSRARLRRLLALDTDHSGAPGQ